MKKNLGLDFSYCLLSMQFWQGAQQRGCNKGYWLGGSVSCPYFLCVII